MPHDSASSIGTNGAATIEVRRGRTLPPGPGMFVSDGKGWRAQMTPVTTQQRDPVNPERWIDVPVIDPATGAVLMQVNPAAVDTLERELGKGTEILPLAQPPENPMNVQRGQMEKLIELQASALEAQKARDERTDRLIDLLAQNLPAKGGDR